MLSGGDLKTERYPILGTGAACWYLITSTQGAFYLDEMSKGSQCANEVL